MDTGASEESSEGEGMKTEGRPQEIIEAIVRRNETENKTDTIDFIFLSWLWEDFQKLHRALEEIADPIKFLREEAEKQGNKLDGMMCVHLSESAGYLRNIAITALKPEA